MKKIVKILVALLALGSPMAMAGGEGRVADLAWLSGKWEGMAFGAPTEYLCSNTSGNMLLCLTKIASEEALMFHEFERFEEVDGRVVLYPYPMGNVGVSFTSTEISPGRVVFENPQHDNPNKITYLLLPDGSLKCIVEGMENGAATGFDFVLTRSN